MITREALRKEFGKLINKSKFEKQIEFASLLTEYVKPKGIKPIIVEGLSVEIYTRNDYHTHDIDFVSDGWNLFDEILTDLGFDRTQRVWYHKDAEIAVEVPSNHLEGSEDHIYEILLPSNRIIYVIGVEDIIIHRLEGISFIRYPRDDEDYESAYRMFLIHQENMDMDYFMDQAKNGKVFHLIEDWF